LDWSLRLVLIIFAMMLMATLVEMVVNMLAPLLPWIVIGVLALGSLSLWLRRHERW